MASEKKTFTLRRYPFATDHSAYLETYENDTLQMSGEKSESREEGKEGKPREPHQMGIIRQTRLAMLGQYPS